MTTLAWPTSGFAFFSPFHGVSADARRTDSITRRVTHDVRIAPASAMSPFLNELLTLARDDGVDPAVLAKAVDFAYLLPADVCRPEISIDPDGDVAFDWGNEDGIVSVSVAATGRIVFASELSGYSISGTTQLSGEIPGPLRVSLAAFRNRR